ncbi:hypothetical protein EDD18DRAFT_1140482, partial [Armillaria luteobubalina]
MLSSIPSTTSTMSLCHCLQSLFTSYRGHRIMKVACDVSTGSSTVPSSPRSTCLPTTDDQKAIWPKIDTIEDFSVGATSYLATEEGETTSPWSRMDSESLPDVRHL